MSLNQSQLIVNFVHQNNITNGVLSPFPTPLKPPTPSKSQSTPRSWATGTIIERPKVRNAVTSQFPFTICNCSTLLDTMKSVRMGVTHAVQDYHRFIPQRYQHQLADLEMFAENAPPDDQEEVTLQLDDQDDATSIDTTLCSVKSSAPSSILSAAFSPDEDLNAVKQRFVEFIEARFTSSRDDADFELLVNYTANTYFQDLETSDTFVICQKILAQVRDGLLYEEIDDIFISQYNHVKMFSFMDYTYSCFDDGNGQNRDPSNPRIFDKYSQIWKLNPSSYRDLDFDYCKYLLRDIPYVEFDVVDAFSKFGLLMNLDKFLFYYDKIRHRKVFHVNKKRKETEEDSMQMNDLKLALKLLVKERRYCQSGSLSPSSSPSPKNKLLRFINEEQEVFFSQFEPPIYVNIDMNDNR